MATTPIDTARLAQIVVDRFAAGWDQNGLTGLKTAARVCLDILRSIANDQAPGPAATVASAPDAVTELVGICEWIEKTFDLGADRSQVADPAIIARTEIYAGILARIAELKEGA